MSQAVPTGRERDGLGIGKPSDVDAKPRAVVLFRVENLSTADYLVFSQILGTHRPMAAREFGVAAHASKVGSCLLQYSSYQ